LGLFLKVTKVNIERPKLSKIVKKQHKKKLYFPQRAKKALAECQNPPQELEEGLRSRPYLLFIYKMKLAWYLETTGPVAAPGVLRGAHHGVSMHCTGLTIGSHWMSLNLGS
jgi:hypothetical protein